jgi:FkbM family methyltransferase
MIPRLLKPVVNPIKWLLRQSVKFRINSLPLSLAQADRWVHRLRSWPALFHGLAVEREIALPHDIKMTCGIIDVIERHLRTKGVWDPGVLRCIERELKPGDTFLDIGANIGFFTLNAARLVGARGRVISIEPSQRAAAKLLANVLANHVTNVLVLTIGAADVSKLEMLNIAREDNAGASAMRPILGAIGCERIAVARMDDVLETLDIVPTVIKIDIEGAEFAALIGLTRTLSAHHPAIIVEMREGFSAETGIFKEDIVAFLVGLGYSPNSIDYNTGETCPVELTNLQALEGDALFAVPIPIGLQRQAGASTSLQHTL